jgi:hypothetical protein
MTIRWTPENDQKLRSLYDAGYTLPSVAHEFGISFWAARARARRIGVAIRPRGNPIIWTPEMDAALRQLRADGVGLAATGQALGVCNSAVKRRVQALGLPMWDKGGGRKRGPDVVQVFA